MRKMMTGLVVLLIAGAFAAGYWPQRQQLEQARSEAAELRRELAETTAELTASEAKARLGRVFGDFLALSDAVAAGNFGEAQARSSTFFDRVRDEGSSTTDATVRTALDAVLMRRDTVTAGLARGEGAVREVLELVERDLRRALGYAVPPLAVEPPVSAEAAPRS
jgi:hypothetical protein